LPLDRLLDRRGLQRSHRNAERQNRQRRRLRHAPEFQRALAAESNRPTIVRRPQNKAACNDVELLSHAGSAAMKDMIDETYAKFAAGVAADRCVQRSAVEEKYGSGLSVMADDAKLAGMIDRVEPFQVTFGTASGRLQARSANVGRRRPDPVLARGVGGSPAAAARAPEAERPRAFGRRG
jgi:hypothetical protein